MRLEGVVVFGLLMADSPAPTSFVPDASPRGKLQKVQPHLGTQLWKVCLHEELTAPTGSQASSQSKMPCCQNTEVTIAYAFCAVMDEHHGSTMTLNGLDPKWHSN